jgi:hypothetical protein
MQVGTVGMPLDLAASRDFEALFAQMRAAGQTLFMPMSLYEAHPVPQGTDLDAAFFPPPYGTADSSLYEAMRAYGIKMVVPASLIYPLGQALPGPQNDPLVALIEAAGIDLVAAVYSYDEPILNGVPESALKAVYQHVKAISPDLPVIQVNAPPEHVQHIAPYLSAMMSGARWADQIGFSIYDSGLEGAGFVTPYSAGATVDAATALADYMRWLEFVMPEKSKIGILQGFGLADLFSDSALAAFDPAIVAAAQAPGIVEMSEAVRALPGVDTLMWFGPSYLDSSLGRAWQDILAISAGIETATRAGVGALGDRDSAANVVSEAAVAGAQVGIVLSLDRNHGEAPVFGVDDQRFSVLNDGTIVLAGNGLLDFERETEVELTAWSRLADGRIATQDFVIAVADAVDQVRGTSFDEELVGGETADDVAGLDGADWLWARGGDDLLDGGGGNDVLLGEAGADTITGGGGADALLGGTGDDRLTSGADADMFVFRPGEGHDIVTDFTAGMDKIVLVGRVAPGLAASGTDALVLFGGTEILLQGVNPSTLTLEDFHFLDSL